MQLLGPSWQCEAPAPTFQMASSDADIALVADTEAELQLRVRAVLRYGTWWATQATAGQKQQSLSTAGSLATIAQIIREGWPAGADFGSSDHISGTACLYPWPAAFQLTQNDQPNHPRPFGLVTAAIILVASVCLHVFDE